MGIFDHIVQQAGRNADHIEFHISQNAGDFQGVRKIGFSGQTNLTIVDPGRVNIGTVYDVQIRIWEVSGNFIDYVIDTDHRMD
jgi:hypothetical protein